jgi:hypothetical protein
MQTIQSCLVIFIGESFRSGGQFSRIIGRPESFDDQMIAVKSHIRFLKLLSEMGYHVSTYIGTYETPYVKHLLHEYQPSSYDIYQPHQRIGLNALFHNSYKHLHKNMKNKFSHFFYFRIDLFLKEDFFRQFFIAPIILFPSLCWKKNSLTPRKYPRVNDTMLFVPNRYFHFIPRMKIGHENYEILRRTTCLLDKDLGFLFKTFHDSDTSKDLNPYYRIVNRQESKVFHSPGWSIRK